VIRDSDNKGQRRGCEIRACGRKPATDWVCLVILVKRFETFRAVTWVCSRFLGAAWQGMAILVSREGAKDRQARHDDGMGLDGNPSVMMECSRLGPDAA